MFALTGLANTRVLVMSRVLATSRALAASPVLAALTVLVACGGDAVTAVAGSGAAGGGTGTAAGGAGTATGGAGTGQAATTASTGAGQPGGCTSGIASGDHSFTLEHDGLQRSYNLYLPAGYADGKAVPLVLNFHGFTSNPAGQAAFSGMNQLADSKGFAVLYPAGIGNSWNGGPICCGEAAMKNIDDVGFARQLVADVATRACIDQKRVYSTGMSNGGFMSHRLACEASDLVAAVAPVDGLLGLSASSCNPARAVPIVHFYGTEDMLVSYQQAKVTNQFWLGKYNCADASPEVTYQKGAATCETWDECDDGVSVTMCSVEGMGHCWPGQSFCPPSLGAPNTDLSANEFMWQLFEKHTAP